jgi:hypothetical protein
MNNVQAELIYAVVIVVVLLGLSGYFFWRQWLTLHNLPKLVELSPEEKRYRRSQAYRRITNSLFMVILAGLLISSYGLGQEKKARELATGIPQKDPEQQQFLTQYTTFWIVFALVLLCIIFLAFWDILAINRFARNQYRRLFAERREMIERQVAKLRRERNGY